MNREAELYREITRSLTDRTFLKAIGMKSADMKDFLSGEDLHEICRALLESRDSRNRFLSNTVIISLEKALAKLSQTPDEGWLQYCYNYILGQLFPEKVEREKEHKKYSQGRLFLLQFLKTLYHFERQKETFDPTLDIHLLRPGEYENSSFTKEYNRFVSVAKNEYVYEFMRIGSEITPYNTLGHVGGVHYVAMHVARQLWDKKVPVDLGLVSGAAAGHDIGKYGCKKKEEKRIPYLHYYYTDLTFSRFNLPTMGHIAGNHSVWDLELENLSIESLILIYSDFRVKSSRNQEGQEIVNFYSLDDSFQVILGKLDNVDDAKKHRYRRVYNKLKNFEEYMISQGVNVKLPEKPEPEPQLMQKPIATNISLLDGEEVVNNLKYTAIEHNVILMNKFTHEEKLASLLENARSEREWKNLRTYVSILGEYSTYMSEKQKLMTLRFLRELLTHKESDIRGQAGAIIGQIIAKFNEEYKKELPEGVSLPQKDITNMSLWKGMIQSILNPDYKMTDQHKKRYAKCLKDIFNGIIKNCTSSQKSAYIDALVESMLNMKLTEIGKEALFEAFMALKREDCSKDNVEQIREFAETLLSDTELSPKLAGLTLSERIAGRYFENQSLGIESDGSQSRDFIRKVKEIMGFPPEEEISRETLSEMYLDNLKAKTPWVVKVANIMLMLDYLKYNKSESQEMHIATHLSNLVKVSEMVTVRKFAGRGLLSIIDNMSATQRNEIAVELYNGLEIGDYQFTKFIPNYLGVVMAYLPSGELDEILRDLEKHVEGTDSKVASAVLHTFGVMIENYGLYEKEYGKTEIDQDIRHRKTKLISLLIRGLANYNSIISQEALWSLGIYVFGSEKLSLDQKHTILSQWGKKLLTLTDSRKEEELEFFNKTAVLNQIYRFICQYELDKGNIILNQSDKVAFFPGTFDPFSLSHKEIAKEIRSMGFDVYLALDEFSWSKKTQPRLLRRAIIEMSIADQEGIFLFPDDIPINIANPKDLAVLKQLFAHKDLYFVAGSDVVENASCYRAEPVENSIHSLNHIIFKRSSAETSGIYHNEANKEGSITGHITHLHLEEHFEDISSTRIRENIDLDRDISNLIDPVAQNFIYKHNLYLREPAYKYEIQAENISVDEYKVRGTEAITDLRKEIKSGFGDIGRIEEYLGKDNVKTIAIRDNRLKNKIVAVAAVNRLDSVDFITEFKDQEISSFIRSKAKGSIAVIGGLFISKRSKMDNLGEVLLVEILSELLARDYTYAVYHPCYDLAENPQALEVLESHGFINIASEGKPKLFAVDMSLPVVVFKNVETIIKSPLNKNPRVLKTVEKASNRLLKVLRNAYPGQLVLSISSGIMHHKMIKIITRLNGVAAEPYQVKKYGSSMAVPFGKILESVVVPNTVTKALHTEKYFTPDVSGFSVEEEENYSSLANQARTIKSFNRPVVLVDDMLHKGYRMNKLDPILKENQVGVVTTVVGVLTGRGRDLAEVKGRTVDSAYYLPNLKCWIDETAVYPYLGGDGIKPSDVTVASQQRIPSLNLILPYAVPGFLGDISRDKIYDFSMTCLENGRDILKTLELEYQTIFERKLTMSRLGEVITKPRRPDLGSNAVYDESIAASAFVEEDIARLIRLKKSFG